MPALRRTIGLGGAVATLVGYVIGASVFVLPGTLAARAGPAVVVAYAGAGLLALLAALVAAQIGSALHVSGATYVAISRTRSPLAGFLQVWTLLAAVTVGVPLVAFGFADYLAVFAPFPRLATAIAVTLVLGLANLLPARAVARVQAVLVVPLVAALALVGLGGLRAVRPELLVPFAPAGWGPVAAAVVPASFSFAGLMMIAELSEEVVDPGRTIPRALAVSFAIVLVAYLAIALVVPGVLPWRSLAGEPAPVARAAAVFLPAWLAPVVPVGALLAAATSINAMLLAQSRDVFALARDRVLPAWLAHVAPGRAIPARAVVGVTLLGTVGTLAGASLEAYAAVAVFGVLVMQALAGVALRQLPAAFPAESSSAPFRLGRAGRAASGLALTLTSCAVGVVGAVAYPRAALVFAGLTALGALYYRSRRQWLAARGISLDDCLRASVTAGAVASPSTPDPS